LKGVPGGSFGFNFGSQGSSAWAFLATFVPAILAPEAAVDERLWRQFW
jgi:hypothetical protein